MFESCDNDIAATAGDPPLAGDRSSATCTIEPRCGNRIVESTLTVFPESCDDGNTADGDGCSSTCIIEGDPECGNGVLEVCLGPALTAIHLAFTPCALVRTSTPQQLGEECDDGNLASEDGCDAECVREPRCGDLFVTAPERCDDGNTVNGD
eukprot:gene12779-biopygen8671